MDTILKIVYFILVLDAIVVLFIFFHYLIIGHRQKFPVDFEEYLQDLPREAVFLDPHILVDGKWVKTNQASPKPTSSASGFPS